MAFPTLITQSGVQYLTQKYQLMVNKYNIYNTHYDGCQWNYYGRY